MTLRLLLQEATPNLRITDDREEGLNTIDNDEGAAKEVNDNEEPLRLKGGGPDTTEEGQNKVFFYRCFDQFVQGALPHAIGLNV